MNVLKFFNQYLGRHLVEQTGNAVTDAQRVLSAAHPLASGKTSRLSSGWALTNDSGTRIQLKLDKASLTFVENTRYEAWLDEIENWTGKPTIFMEFDQKLV